MNKTMGCLGNQGACQAANAIKICSKNSGILGKMETGGAKDNTTSLTLYIFNKSLALKQQMRMIFLLFNGEKCCIIKIYS